MCLSTTALRCHSDDVVAANHEYTLILDQLAVADEESTTVNEEDFSLAAFATILLDIVFVPDL